MDRRLLLASGVGLLTARFSSAETGRDAAWVDQRVEAWQPTERERRWEGIGWAKDLAAAESLSRQHKRPIFLFTLDGRMNVGRC